MFLLSPLHYLRSLLACLMRKLKGTLPAIYVNRRSATQTLASPENKVHFEVLAELYLRGGTLLRSCFSRTHQTSIAALASMGFISSYLPSTSTFTREWRVTSTGAVALEKFYA